MSKFEHTLIDLNDNGDIVEVGNKTLYNLDNSVALSKWVRSNNIAAKKLALPLLNGITIQTGKVYFDSMEEDAFGFFYNKNNDIINNHANSAFFSSVFASGGGGLVYVKNENFIRCCVAFTARRIIKNNVFNATDEYMKPNTDDPRYPEFEADSLVYSLFDSASQQSSLRKVEYKGKAWDVKNEFFWIPSKTIAEWADAEGLDETYAEASTAPDRHMAKVLNGVSLSAEAKAVLDKATELVQKSMKFRQMFNDDHPEYQVLNFDSSYYQLKPIWKQYMPKEFKIFRELQKKLADKMRPMVYELGFLNR